MAVRTVECHQCHQSFEARDWRENRPTRYCSRRCRDAAQTTRVTLMCVQCHRDFDRKAYQQDWSKERGPFCGMACYAEWQRQNLPGVVLKAQSNARYSGQWERNREAARRRDGNRCVECGAAQPDALLHVHHVVPWEPGQADPHALDNLVTLCALHHRRAHRALGGQ
jgi:5-methylcytosine-specific restriction endonuclease McrA